MDIKGYFAWICIVCNVNAEFWIWSQSTCTVNGKCSVFSCYKSEVTECSMYFIGLGIGKSDF